MLFSIFYIARMVLYDFTSQHVPVDVCINFRSGDGLVSQHTLDGPQIGSAFQQVGGEGVAEGVRTDSFGDSGGFSQFFDDVEDHDA